MKRVLGANPAIGCSNQAKRKATPTYYKILFMLTLFLGLSVGDSPIVGVTLQEGCARDGAHWSDDDRMLREFESEKAFEAFIAKRLAIGKAVPKLRGMNVSSELADREWDAKSGGEFFYFSLPARRVPVLERSIVGVDPRWQVKVAEAIDFFPEITRIVIVQEKTTPLVQALVKLPRLRDFWYRIETPLRLDYAKILGEHPTLRDVEFWCPVSDEAFEALSASESLEDIMVGDASPRCFLSLAKMPRLSRFRYSADGTLIDFAPLGFRQPIDNEIRQAIESLDGRLTEFYSTDVAYIHPAIYRALSRIKSLRHFVVLGKIYHGELTLADFENLKKLDNLERFILKYDFEGWSEADKAEAQQIVREVQNAAAKRAESRRTQNES